MNLESDHHGVVVDLPMHREPFKPWIAAALMVLVLVFSVPAEGTVAVVALALVGLCLLLPDRRRQRLTLSHDTLTFEFDHLGDSVTTTYLWDRVSVLAHPEERVLELGLDGERVKIDWHGEVHALHETVGMIQVARDRYDPALREIEPEPEALQRLREPLSNDREA